MPGSLPPAPIGEPPGSFAWEQWYTLLTNLYTSTGAIPWDSIDTTGSNITDIATRDHNNLQSIQGGTSGEYYHLTSAQQSRIATGMSPITNSLGADVALNNTANYFTGPTVAQGTSGTWFASGTICINDTAGAAAFNVKLWDGTTVIASARHVTPSASSMSISISGYIASPAGNIRISVQDTTATTGKINFNASGNSKDSTLTAIRIA
jgi:hypothetical protein